MTINTPKNPSNQTCDTQATDHNLANFLINRKKVTSQKLNKPPIAYTPQVKIDSLYKPILRRFRAHFREKFDTYHNKKLYQHWTFDDHIRHVRTYITEDLHLPESLRDIESIIKMVTLLFPCSTRKQLPLLPELTHPAQRLHFAQVFRENNLEIRHKFFQEPLIQYLWSEIFIKVCPEVSVAHLRRIRSHSENGDLKFNRFMTDVKKMEVKVNVKILPDICRDEKSTTVFSEKEKIDDLFDNAKYNKKHMQKVNGAINPS